MYVGKVYVSVVFRWLSSKCYLDLLTLMFFPLSSVCQPVVHPAAINLSHTLTQSDHPPHTPHTSHTPHSSPSPPIGILSPSLDSIRNNWGKDKNGSLGYHSMKGELVYCVQQIKHRLSSHYIPSLCSLAFKPGHFVLVLTLSALNGSTGITMDLITS